MADLVTSFLVSRVVKGSFLWNALSRVRGRLVRLRMALRCTSLLFGRLDRVNAFEARVYSQGGEDGILHAIFRKIGTTNKFCVEFGVEDGRQRNTRLLEERGWSCLLMDCDYSSPSIKKEFVTAENVNALFQRYGVPSTFDLLSIDIDGNDYWVWNALDAAYSPRVVVIEYNSKFPPGESKVIAYERAFVFDRTDYYSASLLAMVKLGRRKGYTLVGCDVRGVNAFFVRDDAAEGCFVKRDITELYRPPAYLPFTSDGGWPAGPRSMIDI
jgi:hypothetical protein